MKLKIKNDTTLKATHNGPALWVLGLLLLGCALYLTYVGFTQNGQAVWDNLRLTSFLTLGIFLLMFYTRQWLRPTTRGGLIINKVTGTTKHYLTNAFGAQHQGDAGSHIANPDIIGIELSFTTHRNTQSLIEHLSLIVQPKYAEPGDTILYPITSATTSTHHVGFALDMQANQIATFLGIPVTRKTTPSHGPGATKNAADLKAAEMAAYRLTGAQGVPRLKDSTLHMSVIALITAIVLPPIGFILAQLGLRRISAEHRAAAPQQETPLTTDQKAMLLPLENDAVKVISRLQIAGILAVCCTLLLVTIVGPKLIGQNRSSEHTASWDVVNSIEHNVYTNRVIKENSRQYPCSGLQLTPNLDDQVKADWDVTNQFNPDVVDEYAPDNSEISKDDLTKLYSAYVHIYKDEAEDTPTSGSDMEAVHQHLRSGNNACVTISNP